LNGFGLFALATVFLGSTAVAMRVQFNNSKPTYECKALSIKNKDEKKTFALNTDGRWFRKRTECRAYIDGALSSVSAFNGNQSCPTQDQIVRYIFNNKEHKFTRIVPNYSNCKYVVYGSTKNLATTAEVVSSIQQALESSTLGQSPSGSGSNGTDGTSGWANGSSGSSGNGSGGSGNNTGNGGN
jgi:uncharacterized membrane protein YgcG